jgi:hypothetical protein
MKKAEDTVWRYPVKMTFPLYGVVIMAAALFLGAVDGLLELL